MNFKNTHWALVTCEIIFFVRYYLLKLINYLLSYSHPLHFCLFFKINRMKFVFHTSPWKIENKSEEQKWSIILSSSTLCNLLNIVQVQKWLQNMCRQKKIWSIECNYFGKRNEVRLVVVLKVLICTSFNAAVAHFIRIFFSSNCS